MSVATQRDREGEGNRERGGEREREREERGRLSHLCTCTRPCLSVTQTWPSWLRPPPTRLSRCWPSATACLWAPRMDRDALRHRGVTWPLDPPGESALPPGPTWHMPCPHPSAAPLGWGPGLMHLWLLLSQPSECLAAGRGARVHPTVQRGGPAPEPHGTRQTGGSRIPSCLVGSCAWGRGLCLRTQVPGCPSARQPWPCPLHRSASVLEPRPTSRC